MLTCPPLLRATGPPAALLAVALTATPASSQCGCWQLTATSDGSKPTKRHEAAYVEVGGTFFLMGGRGTKPVERYDPVANTWTDLGLPPQEMHHYQPVVHGGLVWSVSAFEGLYPNETPVPNVWTYDPVLNSWAQGPAIPPARNRGSAGVVEYEGDLYVVGGNTLGHNGGYVPWFDRYDPTTDTWTALPDAPHARDHFTAVVVGNKLYAAGGRQTEQPNPFLNTIGPVDVYDFTAGTWSTLPIPLPTQRAGTMTVDHEEFVVVIGGETSTTAHDVVEAWDAVAHEWVTLPSLVFGRHSGGAVVHQDTIYVASGAGAVGGAFELDNQEELDLSTLLPPSSLNLVTNGDFDAGQTGWDDNGTLALGTEPGIAAPSLEVMNGHAGQTIAVVGKDTYTLRCLYEVLGAGGTAEIGMEYLNGGGVLLGSDVVAVGTTTGTTTFELRGYAPSSTASIRLRFYADGGRTLRFDDVALVDTPAQVARFGSPANPYALPPTPAAPTLGLTWTPAIDHTTFEPTAAIDVLALGFAETNLPTPQGTLLMDLSLLLVFTAAPGASFSLPIPTTPTLAGSTFVAQGASFGGAATRLTNALDVTLQAP